MTDEELPENEDEQDGDETPDLPPPSTFAGKARQEPKAEEEPGADDAGEEPNAGSDPETEAESAGEPVEGSDPSVDAEHPVDDTIVVPPAQISGETIEADTLTLSDVEAQREAAHAGLAKRAEKSSFSHQVTTGSHKVQPPVAAPPVTAAAADSYDDGGVGKPPKRRIGWRFTAAAFVIVSSMAAATAVSFLLFLNDIAKGLNDSSLSAARQQLETVEGGAPQTILILGSDKRETTVGDPGRSDTAILLRVDPDKEFLSLMSLPRDLNVPIPGYGTTKINAAYSYGQLEDPTGGGEALAIETITNYLDIPINHVVNVDFGGFLEAVNAIDCVYIDVDRHYFNPVGGEYAEIDVEAGYQKLCGFKALQYVRYRHGDNDLVRGARQQDFIREARQRIPPGELLPFFGNGEEFIDIFTENTSSDIDNPATIVGMLKTFASVRNAPVRQVDLGKLSTDGGVVASPAEVDAAVNQFLGNDLDDAPAEPAEPNSGDGGGGGGAKEEPKPDPPAQAPLVDFAGPAQEKAVGFAKTLQHRNAEFPIFYPTRLVQTTNTSISDESRAALLLGPNDNDLYGMYKFVIPFQPLYGEYYGVSGTNWDDPPILKNPSDTRTIDGREYLLFYEQDKLRLVGWRTSKGSYWVINTLSHALTEQQMLGIATSTRELGG
ncbi:MAG: polyisoprenyl-teichoic acid--peptidoglycan teichoic acid transferase [Solirubrobacterales bacterium]|jgi:LCP family protein required for cell wall assembly|nr:polyisoprenyl-teichoic acid--peptidoglycan teichoic acid transferase [Solirubrobacterales bacterium]